METSSETIDSCLWIIGSLAASNTTVRDKIIKENTIAAIGKLQHSLFHINISSYPFYSM